jgi:hypothetical protein
MDASRPSQCCGLRDPAALRGAYRRPSKSRAAQGGRMPSRREPRHALPTARTLTVIAQDPSVRERRGEVLLTELTVPAEELFPGPCGHRVNVIDFDVSTETLYEQAVYPAPENGACVDPFAKMAKKNPERLLGDPKFHAQNVYAIAMRTLAQFEFALGRRVPWGSWGHQIHIAPHAFAEANAFYSRADRAIFFGYFFEKPGKPVFTCLSHDVVAHETTHALLDGLRSRYMEPSSPDQAAFHEGFADVVALLSVLSLEDVVEKLLKPEASGRTGLIDAAKLTHEELSKSVLLGLADEMGAAVSQVRGQALRRSVEELKPGTDYMAKDEFKEPHRRGELLVAAMMNAFLTVWLTRVEQLGFVEGRKRDLKRVVEDGAKAARHLLTMSIRAIDYCPPTDLWFPDYLSALLTVDREVVPDDTYNYRRALLHHFASYGMKRAPDADEDGTWKRFDGDKKKLVYGRTHYDSMLRDKEEVFRFIWENQKQLELTEDAYVEVQTVVPSVRIGPDGFVLRETVAEYIEILTLAPGELKAAIGFPPPPDLDKTKPIRLFGGGALIFDEYGQLKYQIANHIGNNDEDRRRQRVRLEYMLETGVLGQELDTRSHFAAMHLTRATS